MSRDIALVRAALEAAFAQMERVCGWPDATDTLGPLMRTESIAAIAETVHRPGRDMKTIELKMLDAPRRVVVTERCVALEIQRCVALETIDLGVGARPIAQPVVQVYRPTGRFTEDGVEIWEVSPARAG